ncbi:hypothetical protein DyAD56_14140 [Dyella sp. AD56]|uniref:hypothetical protein n=1 Tax=Dyella sp. AD56 TaxID=1528744 RepID=UPI000C863F22|nr:hypothetical protein [Dyella sp. AD56]PMQ04534.1 hypothetical protein DyAD56_14140 [Dyella sp. AD56]
MISNFFQMPSFLRLLTGLALLSLLFVVSTVPPGTIDLYGHVIDAKQWWANGSGYVMTSAHLVLGLSAVLMLKRIPCGRALHVFGWLLSGISAFIVAKINDVTPPPVVEHVYPCLIAASAAIFAIYLYLGKRVLAYFRKQ